MNGENNLFSGTVNITYGPDRDAVSDAVVKATVVADKQHYSGQPSTTKYRGSSECVAPLFSRFVPVPCERAREPYKPIADARFPG